MKLKIQWNQPSTQRGIAILGAGLLQIFGQDISVDSVQTAIGALMSIAGLIGIVRNDPPAHPTPTPVEVSQPAADGPTDNRWSRDP
jgi:uncharacterized membrane protein